MSKKKRTSYTKKRVKTDNSQQRYFLFILPILLLAVFSLFTLNNPKTARVLGAATVAFRSGVINWKPIQGASGYNIYYKTSKDKQYIHAVSNIPASTTTYTINYLKKGIGYQYIITALDPSGKEFWLSGQKWIYNYQ